MPHVAEHIDERFEPIAFSAEGDDPRFEPIDFGLGQGRSEQKFVPENNSTVNMPVTSSASFNSREAKEFEGEEGLWGNTLLGNLVSAPGGVIDLNILNDLRKLPGGIIRTAFETAIGGLGEAVALALEEREVVEVEGLGVIPPLTSGLDRFIQNNPELAQRFNEKMLDLQEANEDFLIRNDLIYGPDDQPTILGNALSQAGTSGSAIALAVIFNRPSLAAILFGVIQQVSGFQEAVEAGKEPSEAAAIGTLQGIIEAGVSFIGVNKLTKIIGSKSAGIVSKIIASMATEGIEEGVTEALIIAVQNATGVKDISLGEALLQIFQATFYGALLGAGTTATITTSQAVVKRIIGDSVSEADADKVARVMDDVGSETATEIIEQDIDDATTELEIGKDLTSDQPVTKAAKTTGEQQKRVIEIMQQVNEGKELDIPALLDEIFPEARIQRQKRISDEGKVAGIKRVTKEAIRREVVQLQAEIQIAEQQGDEDVAAEKSERIEQLRQQTFADESLQEAVEELEAEGIFPRGEEFFEKAAADIENVLRPLRAGVRLGRTLQTEQSEALQKSLTEIVDGLKGVVTDEKLRALQKKVRGATTIASAERIRRDILSQARKSAFKKFISERRLAIDKTIKDVAEPDIGILDPDSQNAVDSMNKMRKGMNKAGGDQDAVADFNIEQSRRIQDDMGQGVPAESVMLQVRYLDILNEKAKATPEQVASFEDDLNAFIATGKGVATLATAANQRIVDDTIAQARANKVPTLRADIENKSLVAWDKEFGWFTETSQTQVNAMQLGGTPFDLFQSEVNFRVERNQRFSEKDELIVAVSEDDTRKAAKYEAELKDTVTKVIDVPLEGHAKTFDKKTRVRMTRGQLIYAWMITRDNDIRKQVTDTNGNMIWTDELMAMIDQRMTRQDIEFAEGMFEIYRRSYDRLNATYRRIYNRDLTRIEFYSHIAREGKEGLDESIHNETMFIDMIVPEASDGTGIFPQKPDVTKKRVKNAAAEIRIGNVLSMYRNYVWDAEHFISHGEQLRLIDTLMRDEEFKAIMEKNLSPGGFLNFQEHFKIAARSNDSHTRTGKLWDVFETQRQRAFKANLLLNEKIGLGQTATVLSWASRMPKGDFGFGTKFYATNPKEANAILNKHATFRERELNFDSEIEQLSTTGKMFDLMSWTTRKGDGFGVRAGAIADVLSSMKRKGLSEEEALDSAARFAEASQQSTLPSQRSLAQKSDDPLVRTMMMYRSSLVAMLNVSMQSITEYRQSDTSTPAKKTAARKKLAEVIVTQNIIIPGLYATLTGRPITTTILVGSGAAIPFYSELLDVIVVILKNLFDEEDERVFLSGPLTVPAAEAFKQVQISLTSIDEVWESLEDGLEVADIGTFFESMSGILDVMTDFPVRGAVNKWEAFEKFYETDDFLDAALQSLGYREEARERTIKRIDTLTGSETTPSSGRVLTRGEFP